jgi:hypothetical protein
MLVGKSECISPQICYLASSNPALKILSAIASRDGPAEYAESNRIQPHNVTVVHSPTPTLHTGGHKLRLDELFAGVST